MTQKDINAASKEKKLTDFEGETVIAMNSGVAQSGSLPSKLDNQVTFEAYDLKVECETSFRVRSRWSGAFPADTRIHLQVPAAHNVQNALPAISAAIGLGIVAERI